MDVQQLKLRIRVVVQNVNKRRTRQLRISAIAGIDNNNSQRSGLYYGADGRISAARGPGNAAGTDF